MVKTLLNIRTCSNIYLHGLFSISPFNDHCQGIMLCLLFIPHVLDSGINTSFLLPLISLHIFRGDQVIHSLNIHPRTGNSILNRESFLVEQPCYTTIASQTRFHIHEGAVCSRMGLGTPYLDVIIIVKWSSFYVLY